MVKERDIAETVRRLEENMADRARKSLVWDIRKSLLNLSSDELFQIANGLGSGQDQDPTELNRGDPEECFQYIETFMYSKHLIDSEDGGMTKLLLLKDAVDEIVKKHCHDVTITTVVSQPTPTFSHNTDQSAHVPVSVGGIATAPQAFLDGAGDASSPALPTNSTNKLDTSNTEFLKMLSNYEEISKKLMQFVAPTHATPSPENVPLSPAIPSQPGFQTPISSPPGACRDVTQPARDGVVSLRELSYLQRKEFKVQGGQVGDLTSDISYNTVCKQIDEGIREGYADTEVVRGVLKIIRPGTFKEMLINKDDLTVVELKAFLQAHLREKTSTELFQELMCAKQEENETPQQFLYRVIGLKQRILFTSKQADAAIKYSPATVQDVFLHSVFQGFGHKHADIRRELKPLLSNSEVTDEIILRQVMRITTEDNERQKRLGTSRKHTATHAHSAQLELNMVKGTSHKQETADSQTKPDPVKELAAKVDDLTKMIEAMQKCYQPQPSYREPRLSHNRIQSNRGRPWGCPQCVDQQRQDCNHCFTCGEEGHRSAGCLKRQKRQGNSNRPL